MAFRKPSAYGFFPVLLSLFGLALHCSGAGFPDNWRFVTPLPQGNDLNAAWAAAPDDLYVGGTGGVIQHWDGTNWTRMATPTSKTIFAIHGLSNQDVWAVGGDSYTTNQNDHCLVMRWNGLKWTEMTPPKFSGYTYALNAVRAVGAKDVWGTADIGTFPVHYNGTSWEFVPVPLSVEGSFEAIYELNGHVFFAGTHGQIVRYYNGTWTLEQKTETGNFSVNILSRLWGTDLENLYAGGTWGQVYRRNADGTWTDLGLGTGLFGGLGMTQIWGTSRTNVYFMGTQTIRHFNGTVVTATNNFEKAMRLQWTSGAGVGDRIYGVGPSGVVTESLLNGQGGGTLSPLAAGGEAYYSLSLSGAASCGTNGLLLYGSSLYRSDTSPLVFFDGHNSHDFPVRPTGMSTQSVVNAAWAGGLDNVVIAWDNQLDFYRGVHRWNGVNWQSMGDVWNQPTDAVAFWSSSAGKLYSCGAWRVMRWNGTNDWETIYQVPEADRQDTILSTIWGKSDAEIYVGAKNGKILRYSGSSWKAETTPGTGVIQGICGSGSDVYAVGDNGLIWRRGTSSWQKMSGVSPSGEGDNFTDIVAGTDGVYAAQYTSGMYTGGGLGLLWRLKGTAVTNILKGLSKPMDVLGVVGSNLYGLTIQSSIISDKPSPANMSQMRVDFSATNWVPLGNSGVDLRPATSGAGRPFVAAWPVSQASMFLSSVFPGAVTAEQHWIVRADVFPAGSALPPAILRFHYNPAKLPVGVSVGAATLLRFHANQWTQVPAVVDEVSQTITTQTPSGPGEWTIGWVPSVEPPLLAIARVEPQGIRISWPVSSATVQLESSGSMATGTWLSVTNVPTQSGSSNYVVLPASEPAQHYRLRTVR